MTRRRTKPRGVMGYLVTGGNPPRTEFRHVVLPQTKAEIEKYFLERALENAERKGIRLFGLTSSPIQNPESDFDFTLPTIEGEEYLDLLEVAPLAWVGGPHNQAPASYMNGQFAHSVLQEILKKSRKYATKSGTRVHLLLYPTDWRRRSSPIVQIMKRKEESISCFREHRMLSSGSTPGKWRHLPPLLEI